MNTEDPTRRLGFLLHEVSRLMRRNFDRQVKPLGLTQAQWRTLAHLARNEGITQVMLAEILEIRPMTLARLIDRLQAAGWVERRPDPADRRAHRLFLTGQAAPMLQKMDALAHRTREEAIAGLSVGERQQLIDVLCAIKSNLVAAEAAAPPPTNDTASDEADDA